MLWIFLSIFLMIFTNGCTRQRSVESAPDGSLNYNVVFICIDNLRADHMEMFGYNRKTMPYFSKWASEAQVFENFYSTTQMTIPSEGSAFTGRYPFENGLISFEHKLWPQIENVATIFSRRGYHTLASGNSVEYKLFTSVRESFRPLFNYYDITLRRVNGGNPYLESFKKFLTSFESQKFFIWMPMGTVHSPYGFPFKNVFSDEKYSGPLKKFENFPGSNFWIYKNTLYPITPDTDFNFIRLSLDSGSNAINSLIKLNESDLNWMIGRYDDGIIAADRQFEEIMKEFEKRDLIKSTIFVVYSNHGEELNEHGYFGHLDIYQGNVQVPLIIKVPTAMPAKRHNMLATTVDILPTLMNLMKIKPPSDLDGIDLFSPEALKRKSINLLRTPLWESLIYLKNKPSMWDDFRSKISTEDYMEPVIVTDQYKLVHRRARFILKKYSALKSVTKKNIEFPEYEMYDLKKDPLELQNIAFKSKEFAPLLDKLKTFEKRILINKDKFLKSKNSIQDYQ